MTLAAFMQTDLFNWVIMPLAIFCARIIDISLGTVRVVMIARGLKRYAPLIGFFEVFVWLVVVRQIITSMDNILWMVGYAGGFATGTYIGMVISDRIKMGHVLFRIITKKDCGKLLESLKEKKYKYTLSYAADSGQETSIVYTIVPSKDMHAVGELIMKDYPKAFYTVEDVRKVSEGIKDKSHLTHNWLNPFRRQGK